MSKTKAESYLHTKPENLNCAQSILKAYQQTLNISDEEISEFKIFGGGRAPSGTCGALHAAEFLLKRQQKDTSIFNDFKQEAGAISCFDLKRTVKTPCIECVRIADKLLEEKLGD